MKEELRSTHLSLVLRIQEVKYTRTNFCIHESSTEKLEGDRGSHFGKLTLPCTKKRKISRALEIS